MLDIADIRYTVRRVRIVAVRRPNEFCTSTPRSTNPSCLAVVRYSRCSSRGLLRWACCRFTLDYRATSFCFLCLVAAPPRRCRFHHRICGTEARLAWSVAAPDRWPYLDPLPSVWALVGSRREHFGSNVWPGGVALGRVPRLMKCPNNMLNTDALQQASPASGRRLAPRYILKELI